MKSIFHNSVFHSRFTYVTNSTEEVIPQPPNRKFFHDPPSPLSPYAQPGDGAGVVQVSGPGSVSPAGPAAALLPPPPRNQAPR